MESRVGRVPGIRAKKRRLPDANPHERRAQVIAQPASVVASSSVTSGASTYPDDESDGIAQWTTESSIDPNEGQANFLDDSTIHAAHVNMGRQLSNPSQDIMTSLGEEFMLPAMDFSMENLLQPFPPSPPLSQPAPEPSRPRGPSTQSTSTHNPNPDPNPSPAPTSQRMKNSTDSQFVIDCTQIISDLENYIVADLKSFKIVLGLVKRALEKLTLLGDMQKSSRNMRCIILLTAIMYQIVELLDVCQEMVSEETERQASATFSLRPSGLLLPGLGLGDFGIDAEEQKAWRSQMVLKEVRQASEVLRSMKKLAGIGPNFSSQSEQGLSREHCFVDLEFRLTDLAGRIARRT